MNDVEIMHEEIPETCGYCVYYDNMTSMCYCLDSDMAGEQVCPDTSSCDQYDFGEPPF